MMPAILSELRRRRGWSRRRLAEAARVSVQLVEKAEKRSGAVPDANACRCPGWHACLGVRESVLRGEDEVPPLTEMPPEAAMNLPASPALRLTYELVKRRYGADPKESVRACPAGCSYCWRKGASRGGAESWLQRGRPAKHWTPWVANTQPSISAGYQQAVEDGMAAEEESNPILPMYSGAPYGMTTWRSSTDSRRTTRTSLRSRTTSRNSQTRSDCPT